MGDHARGEVFYGYALKDPEWGGFWMESEHEPDWGDPDVSAEELWVDEGPSLQTYGHHEDPVWFLLYGGSEQYGDSYGGEKLDMDAIREAPESQWDAELADFATEHDLPAGEPGWIVTGSYG